MNLQKKFVGCLFILAIAMPISCIIRGRGKTAPYTCTTPAICEWIDNDIYFISMLAGDYALKKYNLTNGSIELITPLEFDNSAVGFTASAPESILYFVKQPINLNQKLSTPYQINYSLNDAKYVMNEHLNALETSALWLFHRQKKYWQYVATLSGECKNIMLSPDKKNIVLNLVTYSRLLKDTVLKTGYEISSRVESISICLFNTLDKSNYSLNRHVKGWALGYLTDSSLLINSDKNTFFTYKNNTLSRLVSSNLDLPYPYSIYSSPARLVPLSPILTWYDSKELKVHIYNVMTGEHDTLSALSPYYCISPDLKKIAFFVTRVDEYRKPSIEIILSDLKRGD